MTPDDLIQLMRVCSINKVLKGLEKLQKKDPAAYEIIVAFYKKLTGTP